MKHQNQYPTILVTLKDMKTMSFSEQKQQFAFIISNIVNEYSELFNSHDLNENEIDKLIRYRNEKSTLIELKNSLKIISDCLYKHYHQKVIILIDEYDVPLQSAYANNHI